MRLRTIVVAAMMQSALVPAWADENETPVIPVAVPPDPVVVPKKASDTQESEVVPNPSGDGEQLLRRRRAEGAAPPPPPVEQAETIQRTWDPSASTSTFDRAGFRPDPTYPDKYDPKSQYEIYGGKHAVSTPRPLLELGYPLYSGGDFGPGHDIIGEKNLVRPQLLVYGDWRQAYGYNEDAIDKSLIAERLNLEMDLKLTGTERLHALMRPLDHDGKFTRYEFKGSQRHEDGKDFATDFNADPFDAYFEGDLGQIWQGLSNSYNGVDLPIAMGLVPLLFQNGVWMDDAVDGLAFSIPAKHSSLFNISNFDLTFFGAWDEVTNGAIRNKGRLDSHAADIYGTATFFERKGWYYEFDYGYLKDNDSKSAGFDRSFHNVSFAASTRFGAWLSQSTRVIYNFGQEHNPGGPQTADGYVVILENSLITRKPYTLLPYANFFYGDRHPQSMARDPGAGGVLKNVGINFETDNLTGFPKQADNAQNTHGGAVGIEYLFNLDRQIVFEISGLDRHGDDNHLGGEYAFGMRFQQPFWRQWIFRTDAVVGDRTEGKNFWGVRAELRLKF